MSATRLSVIVPTYNRAPVLRKCLEALRAQTGRLTDCEVVVADDGSRDDTAATAEAFSTGAPPRVLYLRQENAGANAARNLALRSARGQLLLFINDDTLATPDMLEHHLAAHDEHPDERVAVLGRVTISPSLPPSRLARLHLDRAYAGLGERVEHDWRAFFTCNVSLKRSLLDRAGGFEERIRYHEDLELAERLSHHGLRVIYRPQALGYHEHFLTEDEFFSIAAREADALASWARLAPRLQPILGTLGFEPAQPVGRRLKHRLADVLVNRATIPFWRVVARRCPDALETLSLRIYDQVYQSLRRARLQAVLRRA